MAGIAFSSLPSEIHVRVARHCKNSDLINLSLVSKRLHFTCLHVLYRHVNLEIDRQVSSFTIHQEHALMMAIFKRQKRLVHTLLARPEYGKYVRSLKGTLYTNVFDIRFGMDEKYISEAELWRAVGLLTHVQSVHVGTKNCFSNCLTEVLTKIPSLLFQSATSVTLEGKMQYGLAKSILNAINPAMLKHLRLDLVQDRNSGPPRRGQMPGDTGEDGRIIAYGATSGLLTTLTGRCTALQTLILRRIGQVAQRSIEWRTAAEEAAYMESAAFIHSIRRTVEKLTFDQVEEFLGIRGFTNGPGVLRIMDKTFRRLMLPTIISGDWPCLTAIHFRGVRGSEELTTQLRAVLGENRTIDVQEKAEHEVHDSGSTI